MIRVYQNTTTRRLEKLARRFGCECRIRVVEPHEEGRYFITQIDDTVLAAPASLGWTEPHAIDALRRQTWRRMAGVPL